VLCGLSYGYEASIEPEKLNYLISPRALFDEVFKLKKLKDSENREGECLPVFPWLSCLAWWASCYSASRYMLCSSLLRFHLCLPMVASFLSVFIDKLGM